jgi:hypothetical protein
MRSLNFFGVIKDVGKNNQWKGCKACGEIERINDRLMILVTSRAAKFQSVLWFCEEVQESQS